MLTATLLILASLPNQAALARQTHFTIVLEEDAVLYIDGKKMTKKPKGPDRHFTTPFLVNNEYFYSCRIEYVSGRSVTRRITFRPGQKLRFDWREKKR